MALWRVPALGGAGAAFSTRRGGTSAGPHASLNLSPATGDAPDNVAANRARFAAAGGFALTAAATVEQVHGTAVAAVTAPGPAGRADGLITATEGVVLTIAVADCAAVYLHDPRTGAIGLCHAGWRGTAARAAMATVAAMSRAYGTRPQDLLAAVSPAIGPCCYEVDAPVISAFAGQPHALRATEPGHAQLDLWEANAAQLRAAGVRAGSIAVCGICTACNPTLLFSHRRDAGRTGRMWAVLWRQRS